MIAATLAGLALVAAPWRDLVPGGLAYLDHVRADGGTRIHESVRTGVVMVNPGEPLPAGETPFRICLIFRQCHEALLDRRQAVELRTASVTQPATGAVRLSIIRGPDPRWAVLSEYSATKTGEFRRHRSVPFRSWPSACSRWRHRR
jgi:hypothetical protein